MARRREALAGAAPPPDTAPAAGLAHLAALAGQLEAARAGLAAKTAELASRDCALADFSARAAERLAALGACPLCGATLDAEAFFAGGHVHGAGSPGGAA